MAKEIASDFEKIIQDGRDRKRNEALAAKIFGSKGRRASAPLKAVAGGSLASRAGINKRVTAGAYHHSLRAGNINGEWTHDLHSPHSAPPTPRGGRRANGPGSLASRITNPRLRRAAQVENGLRSMNMLPASVPTGPRARGPIGTGAFNGHDTRLGTIQRGLTIRGLAGPPVVMAQNFAPGTTAADIESAMTRVGGIISSCRIVKTHPILIAELVFESKEGADNVIATFDNQMADGRRLQVYYKVGRSGAPNVESASLPASTHHDDSVVDGTLGFDDPMDTEMAYTNGNSRRDDDEDDWDPPRSPRGRGLYSDSIVRPDRRGRGQSRGRARR